MLKGDLRKKQILETAEALFTDRGYEHTGVQDILNRLQLSKGSFYHHFESKALVLQMICENRAEKAAEAMRMKTGEAGMVRMNRLLSGMIPFQGEGLTFLRMLLPVLLLPEGQSVLAGYQAALKRSWEPMILEALNQMIVGNEAFVRDPEETARIITDLVNDLWSRVSREILSREKADNVFLNRILQCVSAYRTAVENLISAPYGTIVLIDMEALAAAAKALRLPEDRKEQQKTEGGI